MVPSPGCATVSCSSLLVTASRIGKLRKAGYVPALNEILEIFTPFDPVILFILQLWDRLPHYVSKQINQSSLWLHLCAIGGEWKAVLSHFQKGDTKRPDIGSDGVGFARNSLWGHVVGRANEGVGIPFSAEFAADAEVAKTDLTRTRQEDVGGFDI